MNETTCYTKMLAVQQELEKLNLAEAAERFWKRIEGRLDDAEREAGVHSRKRQMISMSASGRDFIRDKIQNIANRINVELKTIDEGKGGSKGKNFNPFLYANSPKAIAYLALKEVIDRGCRNIKAKSPTLFRYDVVINAIGRNVVLELEASRQKLDELSPVVDLDKKIERAQDKVKKRALKKKRRQLIARMATVDFGDEQSKGRIGMVLYRMLLDEKLLVEGGYEGNDKKKTVKLSDDVLRVIADNLEQFADQKPIFGPLVIPPRPWRNNKGGGYHFDLKDRHTLLKRPPDDFREDNARELFSAVNVLQDTAFHINQKIFDVASDILSTDQTAKTREKLFGIPLNLPSDIHAWLLVAVKRVMADANRVKGHPRIYFTCFLDFRGRYYCKTTYLNPQGSDLCRGLIEFADAKAISDEKAVHWFINHGASCYGGELSRKTFSEREEWIRARATEEAIRALIHAPTSMENRKFLSDADKPWAFLAWCYEWVGFLGTGFGYESKLPVAVDGSCNGIQHFAALMRSRDLAEQVNLAKMEKPGDIYGVVAEKTQCKLRERHKAMTWYSSFALDKIAKMYNDCSWQLHEMKAKKDPWKITQSSDELQYDETIADEEIDEAVERLEEDSFDEIVNESNKSEDDKKIPSKLENRLIRFLRGWARSRRGMVIFLQSALALLHVVI